MEEIKFEYKYKLVRTKDNLTRYGDTLSWIGWNEDDTYKQQYDEPVIGASLVFDFTFVYYEWMTTRTFGYYEWMTTRIISFKQEENCLIFTTQNSEYKLYQL